MIMSGECTFEVESGEMRAIRAGDAVKLEDLAGLGHKTVVTSAEPVRIAAVHLPG